MAIEAGFADYRSLIAHDPQRDGPSSADGVSVELARSSVLDPGRGARTTPAETVRLLQAIRTDRAGPASACASVRRAMARQLTRHRIAVGFGPDVDVAAKSGGLMGVVRNEAGVVTYPDGEVYAVAVLTRDEAGGPADPRAIDGAIGRVARALLDRLRGKCGAMYNDVCWRRDPDPDLSR